MSTDRAYAPHPFVVASVIPLVPAWGVDRAFDYAVPEGLADKVAPGSVVSIVFGHRNVRGIVRALKAGSPERPTDASSTDPAAPAEGAHDGLEPIAKLVLEAPMAPPPMGDLLEWVASRYATPRGVVYGRVVPPRVRVKREEPDAAQPAAAPTWLPGYRNGSDLLDAVSGGRGGVWVLRPTEQDRFEVIAEIAAAATSRGQCVVAVPEVRYGSSLLDALDERLGRLRRVDSARSEQDRSAAWVAAARGHRLIGGGRGSVFVPAPDLAAIVLDEEHHRTFKDDRSPRFDARRVAIERARLQGAACILVSPTPSLDISADPGLQIRTVTSTRDAVLAERTTVELVDAPSDWYLSEALQRRMTQTLADGGRVGLLVPGSGFARAVWCTSCRRSIRCDRCEAGMTYDRDANRLRCPRCDAERPVPETCPTCGESTLRLMGAGSQKVADQLARAFPRERIERVDPDTLAEGELPAPDATIYVTTWIGTKEALRPDVSLVGVLDADALIRRPDHRAAETAYQALWEMATWAGPRSEGGRLVIQNSDPAHHAIQAVVRMDHDFFAERELEVRRELGYPPFSQLIRVRAMGDAKEGWIARAAHAAEQEGGRVLGPITVRVTSRSQARGPRGSTTTVTEAREILVKCPDAQPVAERLRDILASTPAGVRLQVDVDPR